MIEFLTILNSALIFYLIFKSRIKRKIYGMSQDIDSNPVKKKQKLLKNYPDLNPVDVVPTSGIRDVDIRNLLTALSNSSDWKIHNFFTSVDLKTHYLYVTNGVVKISAQFSDGKCKKVELEEPQRVPIADIGNALDDTKNVKFLPNFTLSLWPLYESGSKLYNERQTKLNNQLSDNIRSIIPKSVVRDTKLDDLLK